MALFDKFSMFLVERKPFLDIKPEIFGSTIERMHSPTEASIDGRVMILAGTNNYLGLTFAPESIAAAHAAVDSEGTGTTGSRMANGTYKGHRALEEELATLYQRRNCIVFSTGYQANVGTISGLAGPDDVLVIDAHCHASIYDGCKLSGAEMVRFRHNNIRDLERRLGSLGERARSALIVVEGIYSMLGDRAPLEQILMIKQKYSSYLLIDEAHSLGVLGNTGAGLVELSENGKFVDFITGTFSKSLGGVGGYCVSDHPELDAIRYSSRPYIFTASLAPASVASARAALKLSIGGLELRERLWKNAQRVYDSLSEAGYKVGPERGPLIAARLETRGQALGLWSGLIESGIYVNLIFPPASPHNRPLVRVSVSAAHTDEQVDRICKAFRGLRRESSGQ